MRRTEALQGVRMAIFLNILNRWESAELNQEEAAELLGVSERTFRRWARRYEEEGEAGLLDRRLGQTSGRRVPSDRAEEMERLYRERYQGFTVKPFHEHLVKDHGFGWGYTWLKLGYTWLKLHLQWKGVVPKAPRKGAHRRKRERRPLRGMMLHQDGSRHAWLEGQPALDLIVTLDDATGAIYSVFLIEEEGTASTFRGLSEVFSQHGLQMSLYTDRGAHYFHTPKAGGEIDRSHPTQVGRALEHWGSSLSEPIRRRLGVVQSGRSRRCRTGCRRSSGSPGSRRPRRPTPSSGKSICRPQRAFCRSSSRRGLGLHAHSRRRPRRDPVRARGTAGRPGQLRLLPHAETADPESPMRPHFVKARVKVHVYPDGSHALFHGPRCIGRYDEKGRLKDSHDEKRAA
jgi:transposase